MPITPLRFIDEAQRWLGTKRWKAARPLAVLLDHIVEGERMRIVRWLESGPPFADRHVLADAIQRGDYLKPAEKKDKPVRLTDDTSHLFETRTPDGHIIFLCKHCGDERIIVLPQPVQNIRDVYDKFEWNHRKCPKPSKRLR